MRLHMIGSQKPGKFLFNLFILALFFTLAGCGQTMYGVAKIDSIPPGAEVINLKDDTHLGITPLLVTWESDNGKAAKHATVELRKSGYIEKITSFWVQMRHKTKEDAAKEPQPVTIELNKRK